MRVHTLCAHACRRGALTVQSASHSETALVEARNLRIRESAARGLQLHILPHVVLRKLPNFLAVHVRKGCEVAIAEAVIRFLADGVHVSHDFSLFGPFDYFIVLRAGAQSRRTALGKALHCVKHLEQLSAECATISSCVSLLL